MGAKIRTMWMTPFYLYIGTMMIYLFQNNINFNNLKAFNYTFFCLFLLTPFLYGYISISQTDKRTDYNGKGYSKKIVYDFCGDNALKLFHNCPPIIVKGDEWIAGNLSYHISSRPKWIYQNKKVELCFKDKNNKGIVCYNTNE